MEAALTSEASRWAAIFTLSHEPTSPCGSHHPRCPCRVNKYWELSSPGIKTLTVNIIDSLTKLKTKITNYDQIDYTTPNPVLLTLLSFTAEYQNTIKFEILQNQVEIFVINYTSFEISKKV